MNKGRPTHSLGSLTGLLKVVSFPSSRPSARRKYPESSNRSNDSVPKTNIGSRGGKESKECPVRRDDSAGDFSNLMLEGKAVARLPDPSNEAESKIIYDANQKHALPLPNDNQMDESDVGDFLALARMFAETKNNLCEELNIDTLAVDAQEEVMIQTCRRTQKQLQHESKSPSKTLSSSKISPDKSPSPVQRLRSASPLPLSDSPGLDGGLEKMLSSELTACFESDLLVGELDKGSSDSIVEVNSGGELYFLFFRDLRPKSGSLSNPQQQRQRSSDQEYACVLKFGTSRMATQGEALAYEIAESLGVPSPRARLVRASSKGWAWLTSSVSAMAQHSCDEGGDVKSEAAGVDENHDPILGGAADDAMAEDPLTASATKLQNCLDSTKTGLLIGLVNGPSVSMAPSAFGEPDMALASAATLGRLFALDLVLANPDRLPCSALGWRGNPNNLRWSIAEKGIRGIDHTLARRPPRMLLCTPHAVAETTAAILGLPAPPPPSAPRSRVTKGASVKSGPEIIDVCLVAAGAQLEDHELDALRESFRDGFRSSLARGPALAEELRACEADMSRALATFFDELKEAAGFQEDLSSTRDLRRLQDQAGKDQRMREAFAASEANFGASSERKGVPGERSFSDSPDMRAVSAYELRTRLRHILPRLEAIISTVQQ